MSQQFFLHTYDTAASSIIRYSWHYSWHYSRHYKELLCKSWNVLYFILCLFQRQDLVKVANTAVIKFIRVDIINESFLIRVMLSPAQYIQLLSCSPNAQHVTYCHVCPLQGFGRALTIRSFRAEVNLCQPICQPTANLDPWYSMRICRQTFSAGRYHTVPWHDAKFDPVVRSVFMLKYSDPFHDKITIILLL